MEWLEERRAREGTFPMRDEVGARGTALDDRFARWAGGLFLWLIVAGVAGAAIISQIKGTGEFHQVSERISSAEHLYRAALILELLGAISAIPLATLLYAVLARFGRTLALTAAAFRIAEAIIGAVGIIFAFARLGIYTSTDLSSSGPAAPEGLVDLTRYAGFAAHNLSAFNFGIGSLLFFWLFLRSGFLPRALSWIGIFASAVVMVVTAGSLIFPQYSGYLQYGWAPMAVAEVGAGLWLLIRGASQSDAGLAAAPER